MSILSSILGTANNTDNIPKALAMFEGISKRDPALASKYLDSNNFVNHNLQAPEGVAGIQGFISHLPPAGEPLKVVRAFQDGDYVLTHAEGDIFGPKVFFDVFRFDGEKSSNTGIISQQRHPRTRAGTRQPMVRPKPMIWIKQRTIRLLSRTSTKLSFLSRSSRRWANSSRETSTSGTMRGAVTGCRRFRQ